MQHTSTAQSKGLWGMSRPLLVEQGLQLSVPLLDTFFLSRVNDSAAAAVGALTPVLFFGVNILWVTVFSGSSVAGQRLGAGSREKALATIATYASWILCLGVVLAAILYAIAPWICSIMQLDTATRAYGIEYMRIICLLMVVWSFKLVLQSILNIFGLPQWNMVANIIFFICNLAGTAFAVYGGFGFEPTGLAGVAWANIIASCIGALVCGYFVLTRVALGLSKKALVAEFKSASTHTLRIALPSMIEPLSFDLNMMVLNGFAATLGTAALAAKIYTFNIFLTGLIITLALTLATEILICQHVGGGHYEKAVAQLQQSLKAALWGSGVVVLILLALHKPILSQFTQDPWIISIAFWLFLLAAISEPPRAINVMVGGVLRATGDGLLISIVGPLFTWIVAVPAAYIMAFTLGWGVIGILLAAILDEGCRSYFYWRRWQSGRWRHTHVHALEAKAQLQSQT